MADVLLHKSVADGDTEEAIRLLEYDGADVNAVNINGTTCLHIAAEKGHLRMLQILLSFGANVNAREHIEIGAHTPLHVSIRKQQPDAAELLIEQGADIHASEVETGYTPLHMCAQAGPSMNDIATLLFAKGADVYKGDHDGSNASYWAYLQGNTGFLAIAGMAPPMTASTEEMVIRWKQQNAQAIRLGAKPAGRGGRKKRGGAKKKK